MMSNRQKLSCNPGAWMRTMKVYCLCFIMFLLCAFILTRVSPSLVMASTSVATKQNIIDAVLGRKTFTDGEFHGMDVNKDNKVDVADLVKLGIAVADFAEGTSEAWEGDGTVNVVVNFSQTYTGVLKYLVGGTAVSGVDYQALSGSVNVEGKTSVVIPINIIDDNILDETFSDTDNKQHIRVETIILTLYYAENAGLAYVPGSKTQHTVYVHDNDAIWNGIISNNSAQLHFKMRIISDAKGINSSILTDGNGIIPLSQNTVDIDGMKLSVWPASTASASETTFDATIKDIEIPGTGTVFHAGLKRGFTFHADSSESGHKVDWKSTIQGVVTENISSMENGYLDRQINGTFVLLRQLPIIDVQRPKLTASLKSK
ncbi:MAG: hypothetical protein U0586_15310 [Candidatus Brocadiaceae bacterium]